MRTKLDTNSPPEKQAFVRLKRGSSKQFRLSPELKTLISRFRDARRRCGPNAKPQDRAHYRGKTFGFESPRAAAIYMLENFGPIPVGHTIDRRDPRNGYEPGNLRYATAREQALNTRLHPRFWS